MKHVYYDCLSFNSSKYKFNPKFQHKFVFIQTQFSPISLYLYDKKVLMGLAKKCSRQINFSGLDLLSIRSWSRVGPPSNIFWCILLTIRCLSRTIISQRVLQFCQKLEPAYTLKPKIQIEGNTRSDAIQNHIQI